MKNYKVILYIIGLSILIFTRCNKNDSSTEPNETDAQLTALLNNGKNWVLSNTGVKKDGYDVTDEFFGFVLTIGNKVYSSVNGLRPVWPSTGSWSFQDNNPNKIVRDDGTVITLNLSSGNLIMTFTADGVSTGGKTESVSGEYEFHLISE